MDRLETTIDRFQQLAQKRDADAQKQGLRSYFSNLENYATGAKTILLSSPNWPLFFAFYWMHCWDGMVLAYAWGLNLSAYGLVLAYAVMLLNACTFLALGLFYNNERSKLLKAAAISVEALDAAPVCCGCWPGEEVQNMNKKKD